MSKKKLAAILAAIGAFVFFWRKKKKSPDTDADAGMDTSPDTGADAGGGPSETL
jgi:hypothetical protein